MRPLRLALSLLCYWLGDASCHVCDALAWCHAPDWAFHIPLGLYQRFMRWSSDLDKEGRIWKSAPETPPESV